MNPVCWRVPLKLNAGPTHGGLHSPKFLRRWPRRGPGDSLQLKPHIRQEGPNLGHGLFFEKHSPSIARPRPILVASPSVRLQVPAEGVETGDQLAFLRCHRCDLFQGFLFSPPISPDRCQELLEDQQASGAKR